jgi:fructosamine-3-kinase
MNPQMEMYRAQECISKAELHLSGLIGTESYPNLQKTRIIGFFFENRLQWQFEVEKKKILQRVVLGYIFIYVQIKH